MPNRIVREGILTSPKVALLEWPAEVFYRRLMSVVDDFGVYHADHTLLRAACYPRQLNKASDEDIAKWLTACVTAGLVTVYPAMDGMSYLHLLNFRQQTRAKASKYPLPEPTHDAEAQPMRSACAADDTQAPTNRAAGARLYGDGDGDGDGARGKRAARPQKRPLPEGFAVSDRVRAWALAKGCDRLDERFESFVSYAKRSGTTYADWDEALMAAIRDNWAKLPSIVMPLRRVD